MSSDPQNQSADDTAPNPIRGLTLISYSKNYHKCAEFRRLGGKWTSGPGSDIRVNSPACKFWEGGEAQRHYGG